MQESNSNYVPEIIQKLRAEGKSERKSLKESREFSQKISKGMDEFRRHQAVMEKLSAEKMSKIILTS